jgi:Ca2+-binding RTX toxin-like protein
VIGALAMPAVAHAATVHTETHGRDIPQSLQAVYDAGDSEANQLTVGIEETNVDSAVVTFSDAGAPVVAGQGCAQAGPHGARCAAGTVDAALIRLRDGDDTLVTDEHEVFQDYLTLHAYGGTGADTLTGAMNWDFLNGGPGSDTIRGDRGDDQLAGGTGADRIDAGPGDDFVTGERYGTTAPVAADEIEAGPGEDRVVYYGGATPVHVDLARHEGGAAAPEHDHLANVEDVGLDAGTGTLAGDARKNTFYVERHAGPAVLRGRRGDDDLNGGEAADSIYGGRGNDLLAGGGIGDHLRAGPGDDEILPHRLPSDGGRHDGWAEPANCGRGDDEVVYPHRHDIFARDCEEIANTEERLGISPRVRVIDGAEAELSVHRRGPHTSCRYAIELRAPFPQSFDAHPRLIGRVVFRQDRKTWRRIRVRLNDYGRRLVARPGRLPVWVHPGELDRCAPGYELGFGRDGFTALL